MKLDIRSHTDSGSFKYNESLSDRRAQSTILVNRKLNKSRLTAKDMENQLINKCADNVDCTEEEHQLNRRSEFIIMEL
jgi:outer membrane protein OmpA-like peptidoglycan-associated protein